MAYQNFVARERWFVRLDASGNPVSGSVIRRKRIPRSGGRWMDITDCINDPCCTTTTTTTSSTTTTTTTI